MRISIDCRYIRERPSGIGSYVRALIDHLPQLAPCSSFHLWAHPRAPGPLSSAPNVEQTTVRPPANGLRTLLAPSHLVDLSQVDVLHAPFNTIGRGLPCPSVVTVHDVMWLEQPSWCARSVWLPLKSRYYRHGMRRALGGADRLIAISAATADRVRAHVDEPHRVHVIHHGVHPRFTPGPPSPSVLARLGVRQPYFLVVGQNAPFKNHDAIVSAFAAARLPAGVELVMVQRLHRGGQPIANVRRLPTVNDDELVSLYRAALALVQFSRCEGFGMPALEAAACGAPVIASDIPALREVLGTAALRVPLSIPALADAMGLLAGEASLRDELSARGRERAGDFCWRRSAAAHLEVYRAAADTCG